MKLQKPWFLFTARLDAGAHVRLHLGYYIIIFTNLLLLVASFAAGFLLGHEYERTRHLRTRDQHSPLAATFRL